MDDVMEVDHKIPRSRGGSNMPNTRQLLHGRSHDQKSAADTNAAEEIRFELDTRIKRESGKK